MLTNPDAKQLMEVLRKIVQEGQAISTQISPEVMAIMAAFAGPFVRGVMVQFTGIDDISDAAQVPMSPDQSHNFIMAILMFGFTVGRHYEQYEMCFGDISGSGIPSMNN